MGNELPPLPEESQNKGKGESPHQKQIKKEIRLQQAFSKRLNQWIENTREDDGEINDLFPLNN